jgi:hypothetical protein
MQHSLPVANMPAPTLRSVAALRSHYTAYHQAHNPRSQRLGRTPVPSHNFTASLSVDKLDLSVKVHVRSFHPYSIHNGPIGDDLTLHCMPPSEQSAAALGQQPHAMPQRVIERGAAVLGQQPHAMPQRVIERGAAALGQHPHSMPQRVIERGAAALHGNILLSLTRCTVDVTHGRAAEPNKALRNTMSRALTTL